jgi:hypothetical protein
MNKSQSRSDLMRLLRRLEIKSVKGVLEYALWDMMDSLNNNLYNDIAGRADELYLSPNTYAGLSKALSKKQP